MIQFYQPKAPDLGAVVESEIEIPTFRG